MILVVGAGFSGAVIAERYAREKGKRVLLVERRPHVGGNCHDYVDAFGVLVPMYGPHFFHTNDEGVWEYLSRFTEWRPYEHRVLSHVDGKLVPVPVNIETVNRLLGLELETEADMRRWLAENAGHFPEPRNGEEAAINRVGRFMYEKLFRNYTRKQWDMDPSELDPAVLNRIPVRHDSDDRYFTDTFQAMPRAGYHALFRRLLDHPNIEVRTGVDYFDIRNSLPPFEKLFFTGRIDHYFAGRLEDSLQYRSLRFEYESIERDWYQTAATENYPNEHEYTRISEPKRATGQDLPVTTIVREYPTWNGEPYYPVVNPRNQRIYEQYREAAEAAERDGIYFVGRLANYKYFNMDQAIRNALDLFDRVENSALGEGSRA